MQLIEVIKILFLILGVISLFRPIVIIYTFATFTIVSSIPTIPYEINLQLMEIGTVNIFVYDYLIAITFILLVKLAVFYDGKNNLKLIDLINITSVRATLLFLLWNIFIGFLSYQKGFRLQNVLRHLSYQFIITLCILIPQIIKDNKSKTKFFVYCIFIGCTLVLFAIIRYLTHEVNITSSGTIRVLASNNNTILLFSICYLLFGSQLKQNNLIMMMCIVLFISIGIFLSGYRSGFLVLSCILAYFFIRESLYRSDYVWIPLFCIAGIFFIILSLQIGIISINHSNFLSETIKRSKDTFDLQNKTTQDRLMKWEKAIKIVKINPLLGLGRYPFNHSHVDSENSAQVRIFSELKGSEHNMFIQKLVHEGIMGICMLMLFLFFIFKDSLKAVAESSKDSIFLTLYLASFILYSMFNTVFDNPNGRIFFFISIGFLNIDIAKIYLFRIKHKKYIYITNQVRENESHILSV